MDSSLLSAPQPPLHRQAAAVAGAATGGRRRQFSDGYSCRTSFLSEDHASTNTLSDDYVEGGCMMAAVGLTMPDGYKTFANFSGGGFADSACTSGQFYGRYLHDSFV